VDEQKPVTPEAVTTDKYKRTKDIIGQLQSKPTIEKAYEVAPGVSVTFRSMLAFEHRYFLSWLALSMPADIKMRNRSNFEMGLRNIANNLVKFGDESLSRMSPFDSYGAWVDRKKSGRSEQDIKTAIHDIYNNKLAALKTKSDIATNLVSLRAKKFFDECVDVEYNKEDNKHFDDITLETIIFDSDKTIIANIHDVIKVEFSILTNTMMSIVEEWVDEDQYDSSAEMNHMRFLKYLAASARTINGIKTSGNPTDFGFGNREIHDESEYRALFESRLNYLLSLPYSFVILLDHCRSHLASVMQSKIDDMSGGLKN